MAKQSYEPVCHGVRVILSLLSIHVLAAGCSIWLGGFGTWYNINICISDYEINWYADNHGIGDIKYDHRFEARVQQRLKHHGIIIPTDWLSSGVTPPSATHPLIQR